MRYVKAKYEEYKEEMTYRIYLSETLYQSARGNGLNMHFTDVLEPKPVDTRTADEIALETIAKAGLKLENEV